MSGGCAAACDTVRMASVVTLSRFGVLMLLSGPRRYDVQKKRPHSRNHSRGQQHTAEGAQRAVPIGDTGFARCKRRLFCCLVLCGCPPLCQFCTCVLLLLLLPVTPDYLCGCVRNLCSPAMWSPAMWSQARFFGVRRRKNKCLRLIT